MSISIPSVFKSAVVAGFAFMLPLAANAGGEFAAGASSGSAPVDEAGRISVTIKAADGYKVNKDYPHRVTLSGGDALKFAKAKLSKGDGSFVDKQTFVFSTTATAIKKGSHSYSGVVKLSVCNDEQCLVKKATVSGSFEGK